ncbi:MAG: hypothetical protein ACREI9_05660 [Nitrospiraceae bacterium]
MMANDELTITILDDGTIKIETDQVSMPNHANAEEFLKMAARMVGGETTRTKRGHGREHTHHGVTHSH